TLPAMAKLHSIKLAKRHCCANTRHSPLSHLRHSMRSRRNLPASSDNGSTRPQFICSIFVLSHSFDPFNREDCVSLPKRNARPALQRIPPMCPPAPSEKYGRRQPNRQALGPLQPAVQTWMSSHERPRRHEAHGAGTTFL